MSVSRSSGFERGNRYGKGGRDWRTALLACASSNKVRCPPLGAEDPLVVAARRNRQTLRRTKVLRVVSSGNPRWQLCINAPRIVGTRGLTSLAFKPRAGGVVRANAIP